MTTTQSSAQPRNGVDVETLFATIGVVRDQPPLAKSQFRSSHEWVSGTHSRGTITGFYGPARSTSTSSRPSSPGPPRGARRQGQRTDPRRAAAQRPRCLPDERRRQQFALALLGDGSRGRAYLLKERMSDPGQLVGALREVARGGSVVDPKVVDALVRARSGRSVTAVLTPREKDVLAEMASGKDNTAIAATLVLSVRAVEKNINAIFSKLRLAQESEVHKRVKAVLLHLADNG